MPRIAIFDDYQNVALKLADWSEVTEKATVTVFNDHLSDANDIVDRLREFDAVCVMRERTPLTRDILERSSRLKPNRLDRAAKWIDRCRGGGRIRHRGPAYQLRLQFDDRADLGAHSRDRTKSDH